MSQMNRNSFAAIAQAAGIAKPGSKVAMLGDANHPTPRHLSKYWADRGVPVVLATTRDAPPIGDGVTLVHPRDHESAAHRRWMPRVSSALHRLERAGQRYSRWRGKRDDNPNVWIPFVTASVANALPLVRSVEGVKPLFVFGHEVSSHGLATVLCRDMPRFLLPWGGDIFLYADASPLLYRLTAFILRSADLVLPSSATAADFICDRFGVPERRVVGITWGIDRSSFHRISAEHRRQIRRRWGIDPDRVLVLNVRRFRREWGALVALEAFIKLGLEDTNAHFVMLGGEGSEQDVAVAQEKVLHLGLADRFTLLAGESSMETCTELMKAADVYTSLFGTGDMRSWSVLQATACGGVPIVADSPEHREMARLGFRAFLVSPDDPQQVYEALRSCLRRPEERREIVAANDAYIATHEDEEVQMRLVWDMLMEACRRYGR
jgi:glycosyltransferase involved in cell wall biosynthesis